MPHETRANPAALSSRLAAMRRRHRTLDARVADEQNRPRPDATLLQKLKREKLRLKDELSRIDGLLRTLSRGAAAA